jgi:hypothetical protein
MEASFHAMERYIPVAIEKMETFTFYGGNPQAASNGFNLTLIEIKTI